MVHGISLLFDNLEFMCQYSDDFDQQLENWVPFFFFKSCVTSREESLYNFNQKIIIGPGNRNAA